MDKTKESTLHTKTAKNPSSRIFEDLASEISSYEPKPKPWASDICRCSDREAEKAQLRELNDRHLLLLSEKQGMINCLLQNIETMTKIREVFIDGDREILKNKIDFLQEKIKDLEKQKEKDKKIEKEKDGLIDDLRNKNDELELELDNKKEELLKVDNIKRENAILNSAKKADDEKMKWLARERDHDKENFDNFAKKVFTEKWDEILEKVDKECDGKSYLENISKKLEDLRGSFDDRTAFDEMEAKYKVQLGELQENLQKERKQANVCAGDNSEMKCKLAMLEDQLKDLEKDAENSKLKNMFPDWANGHVNGMIHLGRSGCVNNLPVDLAQELGVYKKILDAVGEEKEKERVEEVCKRTITSKETTTTYVPENSKENELNGSI